MSINDRHRLGSQGGGSSSNTTSHWSRSSNLESEPYICVSHKGQTGVISKDGVDYPACNTREGCHHGDDDRLTVQWSVRCSHRHSALSAVIATELTEHSSVTLQQGAGRPATLLTLPAAHSTAGKVPFPTATDAMTMTGTWLRSSSSQKQDGVRTLH